MTEGSMEEQFLEACKIIMALGYGKEQSERAKQRMVPKISKVHCEQLLNGQ